MRIFLLLFSCSALLGQSNVNGNLPVTLVDGGTDCDGLGQLILIWADTTGLTGDQGAALGLNAFRLILNVSRPGVITQIQPGTQPLDWTFVQTEPSQVTTQTVLVGWSSDTNAPGGFYHLATLLLTGDQGPVTLSLDPNSEVSSRLVQPGNGPSLVPLQLPAPFVTSIPQTFNLSLFTGVATWDMADPDYDWIAPFGKVDVLDLVQLVYCSP